MVETKGSEDGNGEVVISGKWRHGSSGQLCKSYGSCGENSNNNKSTFESSGNSILSDHSVLLSGEYNKNEKEESKSAEVTKKKYSKQDKLILACLAAVNFTAYLCMSILAPFFPLEAELKGMSQAMTGYVFSSYALVIFIISPFIGKILPHVGVKILLVSGLLVAGCCTVLFGVIGYIEDVTSFTVLCFTLRCLEATGAACFFMASCTIVADMFSDNVSSVFGLMETFIGLGMSTGPTVGGFLYRLGGYAVPFYVLGILMLLLVPVCIAVLPPLDPSKKYSPVTPLGLLRHPSVIVTCACVTIISADWSFLEPTLEPHLRELELGPDVVGLMFLAMSVVYGICNPIWGWITDKWDIVSPLMLIGTAITFLGMLLLGPSEFIPLEKSLGLNIVAMATLGLSCGLVTTPAFTAMLDFASEAGYEDDTATNSMVASLYSSAVALGDFIGPALGGVLVEQYEFSPVSSVFGLSSFVIGVLLIISRPLGKCMKYDYKDSDDEGSTEVKRPLIKVTLVDHKQCKRCRPSACAPGRMTGRQGSHTVSIPARQARRPNCMTRATSIPNDGSRRTSEETDDGFDPQNASV